MHEKNEGEYGRENIWDPKVIIKEIEYDKDKAVLVQCQKVILNVENTTNEIKIEAKDRRKFLNVSTQIKSHTPISNFHFETFLVRVFFLTLA